MRLRPALIMSLACLVAATGALADNGKGHGRGHDKGGHDKGEHEKGERAGPRFVIADSDRATVYSYYQSEFAGGHCPPGLAKKDNGCLPPGLAKRGWGIGAPLAPGMTFYPLPGPLLTRLSPAPDGYQYVRVDNDILLIGTATRMVVATLGSLSNLQAANAPLIADPNRDAIVSYYRTDYLGGNCPAGLMRTDLGCQNKPLWALGAPLDPSVAYEPLPDPLLAQLGPPPEGSTYIRLGDHILLMVVETRVIRADIVDLARLPLAARVVAPAPAVVAAPSTVVVREGVEVSGGGFCPPGLAKKNNGCLPPGHAR